MARNGTPVTDLQDPDPSNKVAQAIAAVRARIAAAEQRYGRLPGSVALLAVSKGQTLEKVRAVLACGQRLLGESYIQEALTKIEALRGCHVEWHFIGPVQSNKTRSIAAHFAWVHSVDRVKIAERLAAHRPEDLPPLSVCLQVNLSGETSKSGVHPADLPALAATVAALPRLKLRGLMAIPRASADFQTQRAAFRALRELFEALVAKGFEVDTLSMGMSTDMDAAIAEGATLVRIGTALFGQRTSNA